VSDRVRAVFERYVEGLKKGSGYNLIGYCPIHGEQMGVSKSPSLSVNAETGQWYCFAGCGGGGLHSFLKKVTSMSQADKTYERVKDFLQPVERKKTRLARKDVGRFASEHVLPERILGLFDKPPQRLIDAGFDPEVLADNDVGYDEERDRITFAIRDAEGFLVGISGRNPKGYAGPKYKVYNRELTEMGYRGSDLDPRDYLWRGDKVYPLVWADPEMPVIITEGFKAALWFIQNGYPNTCALMGSSASENQIAFIQHLGVPILLALDNNEPGLKGTMRLGYRLRRTNKVRVLRYPSDDPRLQPDSLTAEELDSAVSDAQNLTQWWRPRLSVLGGVIREQQQRRRP
jgi:DNA primase